MAKREAVDMKVELRVHIARKYKTQFAAAKAWGISPAYVSMILKGSKNPTSAMLEEMGYTKVTETTYKKVKK